MSTPTASFSNATSTVKYIQFGFSKTDTIGIGQIVAYDMNGVNVTKGRKVTNPPQPGVTVGPCCNTAPGNVVDGYENTKAGNLTQAQLTQPIYINQKYYASTAPGDVLEIALDAPTSISKLMIYNRSDCCKERMKTQVIKLLDSSKNVLWTSSALTADDVQTITIPPPMAKYIQLGFSKTDTIGIGQIVAYDMNGVNVTKGRKVTNPPQTGVTVGPCCDTAPGNVVDGYENTKVGNLTTAQLTNSTYINQKYYASTAAGDVLQIELDSPSSISKIMLYNRSDCCKDRMKTQVIKLLDSNKNVFWTSPALTADDVQTVNVGKMSPSTSPFTNIVETFGNFHSSNQLLNFSYLYLLVAILFYGYLHIQKVNYNQVIQNPNVSFALNVLLVICGGIILMENMK
jgi:TusA-related sulfurtransferase